MKSIVVRFVTIGIAMLSLAVAGCGNGNPETTSAGMVDLHIIITSQNGIPLSGAKVVSQEQPEGQLKITGLTDSGGSVTFNGIKTGGYTVDVSRFDYGSVEITKDISTSDHNFTVTLKPSATAPPPTSGSIVTFSDLINEPALFNNKLITVDAYYFSGFEISALTAELSSLCSNPRVFPVQPLIWVTGDLGQSVYQNLMHQTDTPSGYTEHYGHVRITGTFQYGGHYGQLDSYNSQITVTVASILP